MRFRSGPSLRAAEAEIRSMPSLGGHVRVHAFDQSLVHRQQHVPRHSLYLYEEKRGEREPTWHHQISLHYRSRTDAKFFFFLSASTETMKRTRNFFFFSFYLKQLPCETLPLFFFFACDSIGAEICWLSYMWNHSGFFSKGTKMAYNSTEIPS